MSLSSTSIPSPGTPMPPGSLGAITPYRYYVISMLALVSFFNYMDRSVLSVLVEPIKADLGISDTQLGLLAGFSFAIFYASFGIPLARLVDRKSRVLILSISIGLWSTVTALSGLAQNFVHLLFARMGVGIGEGSCVPCTHSLVSDYFPPRERAFALGVFQAAGVTGGTIGLAGAAYVAQTLGWRWAFIVIGLPGLLVGLLVWLTVREPPRGVFTNKQNEAPRGSGRLLDDLKILASRRTYRHIVMALAIAAFSTQGLVTWTPAFFMRSHGLSLAEAGFWLGASSGIGSVAGLLIGGVVAIKLIALDRRWECWFPAVSIGASLPLYLFTFLHTDSSIALIVNLAAAFTTNFGYAMALASFHGVTPPHLRGLAAALVMFGTALVGLGAGPFIIGVLSDHFTSEFGNNALRRAIIISLSFKLWAVFHFMRASRTIRSELIS